MATKGVNPFAGKESKKEEKSEKKTGKVAYAAGEKKEGAKSSSKMPPWLGKKK